MLLQQTHGEERGGGRCARKIEEEHKHLIYSRAGGRGEAHTTLQQEETHEASEGEDAALERSSEEERKQLINSRGARNNNNIQCTQQ